MCLALPARVVELLPNQRAVVDLGGVRKEVSIDLVDDAQVDDYVIIHVGYAIGKIDPEEAARTLALFAELSDAQTTNQPI
ncbi:MAG: HypC/HybG/HupF family hydrogenase formation chaperone [Rhodoferax sp.]|uniref:HypC/HybG/HupF family hydrogenase formation chaperone n=1 Tax=Rhodoferax sp. TaxID=50421 RepID=UPI001B49ADD6|nr:HypC/HybG/HupF family hydrogenase formation chaperone [Rhodoferax sp.]MBP9905436.1 HypC/HybG/HupF family hydrogenase formation chaperone [Rhodoferax sp.]